MRKLILCLVFGCSLMSCDVLEDELRDCIDQDGPRFRSKTLPDAVIGKFYSSEIKAYIIREVMDDRFLYYWSWSGNLPQGVGVFEQGNRTLIIDGVPLEAGTYYLHVTVRVVDTLGGPNYNIFNDYDDGDNLCHDSYSHKFALFVAE